MTAVTATRSAAGSNKEAGARLDIYASIHKAMRAWMGEVLVQAGRTDYTDSAEVAQLAGAVRALMQAARGHLEHENRFVHPAIERAIPGAARRIAGEHVEHERAIAMLEADVNALEQAPFDAKRQPAARLYRRLARFVAENFEHMEIEESQHNAVLWAHYTDDEIAEIEAAIVGSLPPEELGPILTRIFQAIAAPERAAMMLGMRVGAPAEVFEGLLAIVRDVLAPADRAKLDIALQETAAQ